MGTVSETVDQILGEIGFSNGEDEALHRTARGAILMETPSRTVDLPAFAIWQITPSPI